MSDTWEAEGPDLRDEAPFAESSSLQYLRRSIDRLDQSILQLISERVDVVLKVAEYKRRCGLAVYDAERERSLLEQLAARSASPLEPEAVKRIFRSIVEESRRLEQGYMTQGTSDTHESTRAR